MNASKISAIVVFLLSFSILPHSVLAKYSGGSGEPNNPYQIVTAADLNDIGNHPEDFNKCFLMIADVNLAQYTGDQFNLIGTSSMPFAGSFDGNGYVIKNFTYDADYYDYCGLFRFTGAQAILKNINLSDVNICGDYEVGALVGKNKGTIADCKVSGSVYGYYWDTGGLVGYSESGIIRNCISDASVISKVGEVGGLIGYAYGTNLINCHATGNVADTSTGGGETGGLAGYARDCLIANCSATGNVTGATLVGGLVGLNQANITNCFATGDVNAVGEAGGFVGRSWDTVITISNCYAGGNIYATNAAGGFAGSAFYNQSFLNCYCTGTVTAPNKSGSFIGAVYFNSSYPNNFANCFSNQDVNPTLSTAGWLQSTNLPGNPDGILASTIQSLKTRSTFTNAGWDFVWETVNGPNDIWAICEGVSHPKLAWQFIVGDSDNDKDVDFVDFALMGLKWMQADSNLYCGGMDLTGNGLVDLNDLAIICDNWLEGL
jgi:hypothetical protein